MRGQPPKLAVGEKYGLALQDETLVVVDKVGDEVAAVATVDSYFEEEALGLIEVEYEKMPVVFTVRDAVKEGAPLIHDASPGNVAQLGDLEKGFAEAAEIAEVTPDDHASHAGYMEPRGMVPLREKRELSILGAAARRPICSVHREEGAGHQLHLPGGR